MVCSIPRVDTPAQAQHAHNYINSPMTKKFESTQVIFRDLYQVQVNERVAAYKEPECSQNGVFCLPNGLLPKSPLIWGHALRGSLEGTHAAPKLPFKAFRLA